MREKRRKGREREKQIERVRETRREGKRGKDEE